MITKTTTPKALLTVVSADGTSESQKGQKISIIGAGSVGTAIAFTLLAQRICSNLVLIDKNEELARGEMLDIQHATMYLDSPQIISSTDYADTSNSKICILTAGLRGKEYKKEELVKQNTEIFAEILPKIMTHSPNCILLVCSYPVDEMSFVAWKLSGLPPYRVIGSGTILESARFRCLIAQKLNVNPTVCQAFVIGEQGANSIPVWSSVSIAGVRIRDVNPDLGTAQDPEEWQTIHTEVMKTANEVTSLKECGSWGMALSVARIVHAILNDTKDCFAISTHIKGCTHGIEKDVFLSLPCIVGSSGVLLIVRQHLNETEKRQMQKSADRMYETQTQIGLLSKDDEGDICNGILGN